MTRLCLDTSACGSFRRGESRVDALVLQLPMVLRGLTLAGLRGAAVQVIAVPRIDGDSEA